MNFTVFSNFLPVFRSGSCRLSTNHLPTITPAKCSVFPPGRSQYCSFVQCPSENRCLRWFECRRVRAIPAHPSNRSPAQWAYWRNCVEAHGNGYGANCVLPTASDDLFRGSLGRCHDLPSCFVRSASRPRLYEKVAVSKIETTTQSTWLYRHRPSCQAPQFSFRRSTNSAVLCAITCWKVISPFSPYS